VEFDLDRGTLVRLPLHSRLLRGEVRQRVKADAFIDDRS